MGHSLSRRCLSVRELSFDKVCVLWAKKRRLVHHAGLPVPFGKAGSSKAALRFASTS